MSQAHVERVIGFLATDESARGRFVANPGAFLAQLMRTGVELNECEQWSLARIAPDELVRFAQAIDPRLQRAESSDRDC